MRENMYTVPVHLLTLLAASPLLCPSTRVRNSTRFTFTPKKASVARPWFTRIRPPASHPPDFPFTAGRPLMSTEPSRV
uniref:Secreted protein n=1 Tax=Arundo donax TaxID=35708 RepID=A0A0A9DMG3_ARUDO